MRVALSRQQQAHLAELGEQLKLQQGRGKQTPRPAHRSADRQLGRMREASTSNPRAQTHSTRTASASNQDEIVDLPRRREGRGAARVPGIACPRAGSSKCSRASSKVPDAPLNDEQRKRLLAVALEERKRIPMPKPSDERRPEAYAQGAYDWQSDYERARERAGAQHPQFRATHRVLRVPAMAEGNAPADGHAAARPRPAHAGGSVRCSSVAAPSCCRAVDHASAPAKEARANRNKAGQR